MKIFAFLIKVFFIAGTVTPSLDFCPKCTTGTLVVHNYYSLCYSEEDEQAQWVAYLLTKAETNKNCKRSDDFRPDPDVKTGSASLEDYNGAGYDRGHLCPAADRSFDCKAMSETFFLSNMSPQKPAFNRGIWKSLEELVRSWAAKYDSIYIVTGPVLNGEKLGTIGPNKVTVPKYYYKTVLRRIDKGWTSIALILPNQGSKELLNSYVVTVDSLEKHTAIDFYPALPDNAENAIEGKKNTDQWSF